MSEEMSAATSGRANTVFVAAARVGVVAALALAVSGVVVVQQADASAPETDAAAAPTEGTWDLREAGATSSRDLFEGREPLEAAPLRAFTVQVDGTELPVESNADSLAQALAEAGVVVGEDDVVSADMNVLPEDGAVITVQRAGGSQVVEETIDEAQTTEVETDELYRGERRVTTEGVDGRTVTTFEVTTVDGVETGREVVAQVVVTERVDEVVEVGTKERPAPRPAPASTSGGGSAPSAPVQSYSGDPVSIGQSMAAARGWTGDQWSCLYSLWQKESGWNPLAHNRSSGAHGIPQALPGSKMGSHGSDWYSNPATQIAWGLDYIAGRYGSPCGAWSHSQARNWY